MSCNKGKRKQPNSKGFKMTDEIKNEIVKSENVEQVEGELVNPDDYVQDKKVLARMESGIKTKPIWDGVSPTINQKVSVQEAFGIAGLDWEVKKEPVYMSNGNGGFIQVPNFNFTSRQDKPLDSIDRVLGCVGSRYQPIQNHEAFAVINEVMEMSGAKVATAGELKDGQIVYLMIEMPEEMRIKSDVMKKYIMVGNNHAGLSSMVALFTNTFIRCLNTYNAAIRSAKGGCRIRHTKNHPSQIAEASRILKEQDKYFNEIVDIYRQLANYKIDNAFREAYLKAIVPDSKGKNNTRAETKRELITAMFQKYQSGAGSDALNGSAYGLFQATQQAQQYLSIARGDNEDKKSASRFNSMMFGSGGKFVQSAFDTMLRATGLGNNAGSKSELAETESLVESAVAQN